MIFDLWLPEAKRPSSSSRVSATPRAPATQRSPRACSMARNRHRCQQVALFERRDGNHPGVARPRSHRCFTGRHTKSYLKNP